MCCREGDEQWSRVTCGKADGEPVTSARINGIENIPDPGLMELTGNTDISGNYTLSHGGIFAAFCTLNVAGCLHISNFCFHSPG